MSGVICEGYGVFLGAVICFNLIPRVSPIHVPGSEGGGGGGDVNRRDPTCRNEVGFAFFIYSGRKHGVVVFFHLKYLLLSIDCMQARVNGCQYSAPDLLQRKHKLLQYKLCSITCLEVCALL